MVPVRTFLATAVGFAVLAAGCSGSEPAATADSARLAPADAGVYASIDSDRDSSQWQQLEALLARIPGGDKAVEELLSDALGEAGLNWDEDVAPALGPELVVVLPGGSAQPVGLTQPDDEAKLQALLAKSDESSSRGRSRAGRRSPRTRPRSTPTRSRSTRACSRSRRRSPRRWPGCPRTRSHAST